MLDTLHKLCDLILLAWSVDHLGLLLGPINNYAPESKAERKLKKLATFLERRMRSST